MGRNQCIDAHSAGPSESDMPILIQFGMRAKLRGDFRASAVRVVLKVGACLFSVLIVSSSLFIFAQDQPLLLKNARIYTMGKAGILEKGMILLRNGKVEKIGSDITAPAEARVVDLTGKTIMPGMVCASSSLFLGKRDLSFPGDESPDVDILEGLDYFDPGVPEVLRHGVTTAYISPVSYRSVGGLGAVVKLNQAKNQGIEVLAKRAALNFQLDTLEGKKTSNVVRLVQAHKTRDLFMQAQEYRKEWEDYKKKLKEYEEAKEKQDKQEKKLGKALEEPKKPKKDEAKEILLLAMEKKIPVRFAVHRPDAILGVLRMADEFGLKVILERSEEWPQILPEIEKASVPLLSSPQSDYRKFLIPGAGRGYAAAFLGVRESDLLYSDKESAQERKAGPDEWAKLAQSKVSFALVPPDRFPLSARFMRYYASYLAGLGVPQETALGTVTSRAADILGVFDRVGSLEEGKDADLVVLDGEPLDSLSTVEMVIVDGLVSWKKK